MTSRMMPAQLTAPSEIEGKCLQLKRFLFAIRPLGFALSAGLLGCGGSPAQTDPPVPVLGSSQEAEEEFQRLLGRFAPGSKETRLGMESELAAFTERFPRDEQSRLATALLAWVAMERGDMRRSMLLCKRVQAQGAGAAKDLATTVEGAVLRRQGKAASALSTLRPLVSKLIDDYTRMFFNEEIVSAALAAGKFGEALDLMSVWLREAAQNQHPYVRERINALLGSVPTPEMLAALERKLLAQQGNTVSDGEFQTLLARRLASIAVKTRDAKLAQDLIAKAGPLLGDQGEAVAELAAGITKARVEAPTVGLLLSLRTGAARRRGAEAAAGVMVGLGLPGSGARLASRDDGGTVEGIDTALQGLTSEGAAVLIAGLDDVDAEKAAAFAKTQGIAVILLNPAPSALEPHGFVFSVGSDPAMVRSRLLTALREKGASATALITEKSPQQEASRGEEVASTTIPPPPGFASASHCGDPVDFNAWRRLDIDAAVIDAGVECMQWAAGATLGRRLRLGFGFEGLGENLPAGSLVMGAGRYPIVASAMNLPWLKAWARYRVTPPSFWAGLGRDAAVLAWMGVQSLPIKGTEDPKEVAERRIAARTALERARAELWTSEASGFGGGRVLQRAITPRESFSKPK